MKKSSSGLALLLDPTSGRKLIPDSGRLDAKIVLIGEAGGFYESVYLKPFVGRSGAKLDKTWREVGLHRSGFYLTNVVGYRPAANDITRVGKQEMAQWVEKLHERLAKLTDPWLIVPTGNTALKALTGQFGITKWRGSILSYTDRRGRKIKVIPTIHPASILRVNKGKGGAKTMPSWQRAFLYDWQRIAEDSKFRELRLPRMSHIINPTIKDLTDYKRYLYLMHQKQGDEMCLVTDIENPGRRLYCVGFAADPELSITVNWRREHCRSDEELEASRAFVRELWESEYPKGGQNIPFDMYVMWRKYKIKLKRLIWDTMLMHHCYDPGDRHRLAYLLSIYTRMQYYKDEAKDAFTPKNAATLGSKFNHDQFVAYCGKDCIGTRMLVPILKERLEGRMVPLPIMFAKDPMTK